MKVFQSKILLLFSVLLGLITFAIQFPNIFYFDKQGLSTFDLTGLVWAIALALAPLIIVIIARKPWNSHRKALTRVELVCVGLLLVLIALAINGGLRRKTNIHDIEAKLRAADAENAQKK